MSLSGRARCTSPRCGREEGAVPVDGALEAVFELEERLPTELGSRLGGAQVLAADLIGGLVANIRLEVGMHEPKDEPGEVDDVDGLLIGKVEGFTRKFAIRRHSLGRQRVGGGAVLHIEIVAHELSVRADDRSLAAQHGADGAGHDAAPVEVTSSVESS